MAQGREPVYSMETVDGRTLRVAVWRATKVSGKLPILFFNGIGANIEAMAPMAELIDDRDFITYDMPGIGGSPDPVVPYNAILMARIADLLLDRFEMPLVDVMGVSWGGAMAQQFALQNNARVNKLILVATSAGMLMVPGNPAALVKMADPRRYIEDAVWRDGRKQGRAYQQAETTVQDGLFLPVAGDDGLDERTVPAVPENADPDHDGRRRPDRAAGQWQVSRFPDSEQRIVRDR
jgi:pimeloyl-ACP methyl ester carboxylesterase